MTTHGHLMLLQAMHLLTDVAVLRTGMIASLAHVLSCQLTTYKSNAEFQVDLTVLSMQSVDLAQHDHLCCVITAHVCN